MPPSALSFSSSPLATPSSPSAPCEHPMPNFQHLPVPVLEQIAAWVAVDDLLIRPPVDLVNLLLVNHSITHALSSPHTLARVFGLLFDLDAPRRRFGRAALTAQTLAAELKLRCLSLSRLRHTHHDEENFMDQFDLWTAYIMLLEDDGKNRRWLVEYVDVRPKVARMLETVLPDLSDNYTCWPYEDAQAALGAWILALTDSQDPRHITDALELSQATSVVRLLFIFVYNPYIYGSHFARMDLWDLPLPAGSPDAQLVLNELESNVHPLVPPERELQAPATSLPFHFGVRRPLAIPSMAHAAIACYLARTPWGAPQALAQGEVASDYWRSQNADWQAGYTRYFGSAEGSGSKKRDTEWRRLTLSGDLYNGPVHGLDTVVEPGDLEGRWDGYHRMPEQGQFTAMLTAHPSPPPVNLTPACPGGLAMMFNQSVQWRLREYHCLRSTGQTPLSADRAWALDAWFPPRWENYVRLPNGSLRFWDDRRGDFTTYVPHHPYIERDDILDTIVLGKPDDDWTDRHDAFHVYGRVRRADGLIMLRADSVEANGHGRWLWYGYIHCGLNWIGRYRRTDRPLNAMTHGGSFMMARSQT